VSARGSFWCGVGRVGALRSASGPSRPARRPHALRARRSHRRCRRVGPGNARQSRRPVVRDLAGRELAVLQVAELLDTGWVERLLAGRGLADGDDPVARDDEVDLLVEDAILLGHRHGDEKQPDDVAAVTPDARAQVRAVRIGRPQQLLQRIRADAVRQMLTKLLVVRIQEIGPRGPPHARRGYCRTRLDLCLRLDRSVQTDARAEPARPEDGTASGASSASMRGAARAAASWPSSAARKRSASSAAIAPVPAAVTACR